MALAGKRMKGRRLEMKMTLAELGNTIGVAPSTIQRYEAGTIRRPKIPVVRAIADALGVTLGWITGVEECSKEMPGNGYNADIRNGVLIPVVGCAAAGLACHAEHIIEDYEYASADAVRDGLNYVYIRVKGDSMLPLIMEGDLVLVRCQDIVDNGSYAVVIIDNEDGVVKKIKMSRGHIELISENPYYPPRVFEGEECARVHVFGRVVEIKRKL